MLRSHRRAPKFRPAPLRPGTKLQHADGSYCISCGSRNVVVFRQTGGNNNNGQRLIQCQSCGVISPDFSQSKPREAVSEDFVPLDKDRIHRMADQILDAFTRQRTKQKLQRALAFAQGDLGLICYKYLPVAIEVFSHVVSLFGFAPSMEGVTESVRVMQTLAKDDEELVEKLVSIRKLLTPTANWIQEDNDGEKDDERRRELEQQALQQQKEEEHRKELLALENAKKARLRAKKIALGLDPSVERPPVLVGSLPVLVVAIENARLELRVNAKYVQKFQWFFNGRAIQTEEFVSGTHRCTLVIPKLTKRVTGEYFCTCENEERTISTPICRVTLAALKLSRLGGKALGTLSSSPMYSCEKAMVMTCDGNKINLCDAKSLASVNAFPALPAAMGALAWNPLTKMVAAFSASIQQGKRNEVAQVFFYSPGGPSSGKDPAATTRRRKNRNLGVSSKLKATSFGNSVKFQLMDVQPIYAVVKVHAAEFIDTGKMLLVTDMMHRVALYDLAPSFACRKIISLGSDVVCHVAISPQAPVLFVLAFHNKPFIKLYRTATNNKATNTELSEHCINFKFPVHRTSFDAMGNYLAVAEIGFMKSWITIVSVHTKKSSNRRFVAHTGRISGLQWTTRTSLLISSSHDGYIKVWDPVAMSNLLDVHIDTYGVHSILVIDELAVLMVLGYTACRLQSRLILHLPELETSRMVEMNQQAANIQKIWKGRKTRELIAGYIRSSGN